MSEGSIRRGGVKEVCPPPLDGRIARHPEDKETVSNRACATMAKFFATRMIIKRGSDRNYSLIRYGWRSAFLQPSPWWSPISRQVSRCTDVPVRIFSYSLFQP